MANLFTLRSPLMIRLPDGSETVIAELFPHPEGLVYFQIGWHLGQPEEGIHVLRGELQGEGPWKIADHVINVLGCHGSNPELAMAHEQWQVDILQPESDYPPCGLIAAIARRLGAVTDEGSQG